MARLDKHDAHAIFTVCGIKKGEDFHTLGTDKVERLLVQADARKYRKPNNANGSRARYFHAYVTRALSRED